MLDGGLWEPHGAWAARDDLRPMETRGLLTGRGGGLGMTWEESGSLVDSTCIDSLAVVVRSVARVQHGVSYAHRIPAWLTLDPTLPGKRKR